MFEPASGPHGAGVAPADPASSAETDRCEVSGVPGNLLPAAVAVRDWLVEDGAHADHQLLLKGFAKRLNALGIPVDRLTTAIDALHSEYSGIGRIWTRKDGSSFRLFPHGSKLDEAYARSPFRYVHETGEWLHLDLDRTDNGAFGIVAELKEEGYRDYLVVPLAFTNGTQNGITLATETKGGFDARARALLRFILPTFATAVEIRSVNQRLDNVLRIYVGDEPHRAILSGAIRRGQVSRIRSAILFADMRGYTRTTADMSPEGAVDLLNVLFDCLVPPIEADGGEVLKYMGDGLLAIFRDQGDDTGAAAQSALSAAIAGLVRVDDANRDGSFAAPVEVGISLHHGEAAYGNVGSGSRLDFTVIGPDVNLASRIARMNKLLGEPLLMSRAFVNHLWGDPEPLGEHRIEGCEPPVAIYRPRADTLAAAGGADEPEMVA